MPAIKRPHGAFENFIEHEGERSGRRTVSVDPTRLNDYIDSETFTKWAEAQDNEDSWYQR